ncbi:bcl-2-like protein 12 [Rhineura floridana]|uniref:bcl-2-like protein 12 n=1 Tax=Rhineura floridana TaxID=261503 RepID=UPI002AC893BB|nr:bcl-2-like protein 12 [Rhineura floridana]XP_061444757.1 bcl-2-like protein 12 [Rhineura floridana]
MAGSLGPPRRQVEEETRLVLEAFLQRALSNGEAETLGHVGGSYYDPRRYMHSSPAEHAQQCPAWSPVHEEINRVEETKHGFRTSIKRLLQRRHSPRSPSDSQTSPRGSLKRPKAGAEIGEGACQKRTFSFKNFLRKKGTSLGEAAGSSGPPRRPDSLPVVTCYCRKHPSEQQEPLANDGEAESAELYTLVAEKLDHLVKQQQLMSPSVAKKLPSPTEKINTLPTDPVSSTPVNSEELPGELDERQKEQILQKLIALLEEQAGVINKEIEADPLLRNTVSRMSYRSFSRLAEAFTSRAPPGVPSPQLAKLALTMELTRKVAGINSHAVHTLMGYSLQYMDMFVPWLQQHGGWKNIVAQDEIFDLQLD